MKTNNKGFTIIELLAIIAILGLLAGIVVVNVNSSRTKGKDSAVKTQLEQVRNAAELAFDTKGDYSGVCAEAGGAAANSTLTTTGDFGRIATAITAIGAGAAACNESGSSTAYVVWAPLKSGSNFCVDSLGNAKVATIATDTATACP